MKCNFISPHRLDVRRNNLDPGITNNRASQTNQRSSGKKKWLSTFLSVSAILFLGFNTLSAQNWDGGGGDGNWLNPVNYVGDILPVAGSTVAIPNGATPYPTISSGPSLTIRQLDIQAGASAIIPNLFTLNVNATGLAYGIRLGSNSTFTNNNVVNVNNATHGIRNLGGTFVNSPNAEIFINDVTTNGIQNSPLAPASTPSNFVNNGEITIGNIASGGDNGIFNGGSNALGATFTNTTGMITINGVNNAGIRNSALNGPANFVNTTSIVISANNTASGFNNEALINEDGATFTNSTITAVIQLENAQRALVNRMNATFTNENNGIININPSGPNDVVNGIVNFLGGTFYNQTGSDITILNISDVGLTNGSAISAGTFYNNGSGSTISITNTSNYAIQNLSDGLSLTDGFYNEDAAMVTICSGGTGLNVSAVYNGINAYFQNGSPVAGDGAILNIVSSGNHGILNDGEFLNTSFSGTAPYLLTDISMLNIGVSASCPGSIPGDGIRNNNLFTNTEDSRIAITNFNNFGIYNFGVFNNTNTTNTDLNFRNEIIITGTGGISGIYNRGISANLTNSDNESFIKVDGTVSYGILNDVSGIFNNFQMGRIEISAGSIGIGFYQYNGAILNQNGNSSIDIDLAGTPMSTGFLNDFNSTVSNLGGSIINIFGTTSVGLLNQDNSSITNGGPMLGFGYITIMGVTSGDALHNLSGSSITNQFCSVVYTDGKINNESTFTNDAIIKTIFSGLNMATVPIANNGIIIDYNNSFNSNLNTRTNDPLLVDNTIGVIVPPITICPSDPATGMNGMAKNVLIASGPITTKTFQTSTNWYNNPGLVPPGIATFDPVTNILSFTTNPAPGSSFDIHFDVDTEGSGCQFNGVAMVMVDSLAAIKGTFTKLDFTGTPTSGSTMITTALNNPTDLTVCSGMGIRILGENIGATTDKNGNPLFIEFQVTDPSGVTGLASVINVPGALLPNTADLFPLLNTALTTADVNIIATPYFESDGIVGRDAAVECSGSSLALNIHVIPDPINFITLNNTSTNASGDNNQSRRVCSMSDFEFNGTVATFPVGVTGFKLNWELATITGPNGAAPFNDGQVNVQSDCGPLGEGTLGMSQTIIAPGNIVFDGSDAVTPCSAPVMNLSDLAPHERRVTYNLTPTFILTDGTQCPSGATPIEVTVVVYPKPQIELDNIASPINDNVVDQGPSLVICDSTSANNLIRVRQFPTQVVEQNLMSANDMGDLEYDVQVTAPVGVTLGAFNPALLMNVGSDGDLITKLDFKSPITDLPTFDNTTMMPQTVTVEVTPSFDPENANAANKPANTDPDGSCFGTTRSIPVTVLPTPDLDPALFTDLMSRIIDVTICGSEGMDASEMTQVLNMKNMNMAPYIVEFELFNVDLTNAPDVTRSTMATGSPNGGHPNTTDNTFGLETLSGNNFTEYLMNNGVITQTVVYTFRPQIDFMSGAETEICYGPTFRIHVEVLPKVFASATPDGSNMVCQNTVRLVEGVPGPFPAHPGPWTHQWVVASPQPAGFTGSGLFTDVNAIPGGQSTTSQTGAFKGVTNGMVRLLYYATAANGCTVYQPFILDLEVIPQPAVNPITGPNMVCPNAVSTYSVTTNNAPANTYSWTLSSGGTFSTPVDGSSVGINWSSVMGGPHTLTVTETSVNGCETINTYTINIVDMTDPMTMCPADITVGTSEDNKFGDCEYKVNGTSLDIVPSDNCGIMSVTHNYDFGGATLHSKIFPLGPTTVTWTVKDNSGNTSTCNFIITVKDDEYPSLLCPHDVSINSDGTGLDIFSQLAGYTFNTSPACGVILGNINATFSDNCNSILDSWSAPGAVPNSGVSTIDNVNFPVGQTNLSITVDDTHGNTLTCNFKVEIFDNEKPTITCPGNTTLLTSNDPIIGNCGYLVNNNSLNPTATADNCGVLNFSNDYTGTNTLNGATFPVGMTTVTWTINDIHGNRQTCSYVVTVQDNEAPVTSSCPSNVVVNTETGKCTAAVVYDLPRFDDNCGGVNQLGTLFAGLASGSDFPKGVTTVTYRYFDPSNNGPATCSFTVTVNDGQKPAITCPTDVTVNNDGTGLNFEAFTYGVTVDGASNDCSVGFLGLTPVISDNCPGPYTLNHVITYPDGTTVGSANTVNGMMFPGGVSTIDYTAKDQANNTEVCSFKITIKDVEKPKITKCATDVIVNTSSNGTGDCNINIPNMLSGITVTDNCSLPADVTVTQIPIAGTSFSGSHNSVQVVTFTATDKAGNTSTCTAKVTINDNEVPMALCKPTFKILLDGDGVVPLTVANINNGTTDNCHINSLTLNLTQVTCSDAGKTLSATLTAIDDAGNNSQCSTPVMVYDSLVPVINNCPSNIIQGNDPDMCMAFVNFSKVTASDNCDTNVDLYYWTTGATILGGPDKFGASGDMNPANDPILGQANAKNYNFGITTVHYFAVDNFGNQSAECTFTIDIRDIQKPVITKCPDSRNIFVNPNSCSGTVPNMVPELTFKDNCNVVVTQSPLAGTLFGAAHNATQVVTFTVTDQGGNTATCTATLTLKDNIVPVITTCPPSRNVSTVLNTCSGVVPNLLPELVFVENCPGVVIAQTPIAGTPFGVANNDTQLVTFTVTDAAGNTANCTAVLTLKDTQNPSITCPPNVNVPCSMTKITIPKPITSDNCGVVSVVNSKNGTDDASDIYVPGTTTIVVWTVTDVNSNTMTCSMTVTVAPLPTLMVSGSGTYCKDGFVSKITANSLSTPNGTFSWFKNASLTIPVNPAQLSADKKIYTPTGTLGTETVYVVVTDPITGCVSNPVSATVIIIACNVSATDPCNCKNNATTLINGQFDEEITLFAPSGQQWHITSVTGLFKSTSPAPPAAPTPLSIGLAGTDKPLEIAPGVYRFFGIHVDGIGYAISFANGLGDTLKLSNTCYYPNPQIVGLFPDYCQNHPVVALTGNALPLLPQFEKFDLYDATNTIPILLNITQLTPATLAPGTYTVRYTFDAQDNFPSGQYPGCTQTITQQVKIFPVPPTDLACGALHNVSLDPMGMATITSDVVLEGNYGCWSQYIVDIEGPLTNKVTCADVGKIYKVNITDPFTGNKCWGNIKIEDKLAPTIVCADVTVSCNNDGLDPGTIGFPVFSDNCSIDPASVKFNETISDPTCTGIFSAVITRTWFAKDPSGNSATPCTQTISIKRGTLAEVTFPANLDDISAPSLSCGSPNTTPAATGVPTIDGKPIEKFCELMVAPHQDVVIPICDNSFKILRTWTVMDACSNNMTSAVQVIIVKDKLGPALTCPQASAFNYSVNGNGTTCLAIVQAPVINVQDNCSAAKNVNIKTRVTVNGIVTELNSNGGTFQIPFGTHTFTYVASDNCGNITSCSVDVAVLENEPPIAVCDEFTVVSLINPITYVNASTFDDGSYDECGGPVTFQVRRMDNPKCPGNDATSFSDKVPFNCCDVNNGPVTVVLRVTDPSGNFNECMVSATVVDKLKPVIICPADITLQCGEPIAPVNSAVVNFDKSINKSISINFPVTIEETINVSGLPSNAKIADINLGLNITHDFIDQLTIKLISPAGTVVTLFQGGSCGNFKKDINCTFDDEGVTFFCNGATTAITGNVQSQYNALSFFDGENPNGNWKIQVIDAASLGGGSFNTAKLTVSYDTPLSLKPIVTDNAADCGLTVTWTDLNPAPQCQAGHTIIRRWVASDQSKNTGFCNQQVTLVDNTPLDIDFPDDVTINNCTKFEDLAGLKSIKHTGDCELVAVEFTDEVFEVVPDACYKIIRTWKVLDWCKYNPSATNNTEGGIDVDFKQFDFNPQDSVFNDETDGNKRIIRDNGDGYFVVKQVIKVIDNVKPHFYSCPVDTVICSFADDCNNSPVSITKLGFDACAKQSQLKYEWKLDITDNGNYDLSGNGPTMNVSLPLGKHHVWFKVTDGCGNYDICEYDFTVKDCKKPKPVCMSISTDLMLNGMVPISAESFNVDSEDNCTSDKNLKFSFSSDVNDTTTIYDCDSLGMRVVTMWVTDEAGNQDFCVTNIKITDNMNACTDTMDMIIVSGTVSTATGVKVGDASIKLAGSNMLPITTNATGKFEFPAMHTGGNYSVVPNKDINPLNGVSTLDLVMITNHILGKKSLDSPYKLIAADANNNGNVTTGDLAEIRKLILHIKPTFSNTTSWRFVEKNYVFPNPANPWSAPFPEVCNMLNIDKDMTVDFIGIKVGDVSGDVQANSAIAPESRNAAATITFVTDDKDLKKDETYTMMVESKEFINTIGYQFTLEFDKSSLEFTSVQPLDLDGLTQENFGLSYLDQGKITTSWNGPSTSIEDGTKLFEMTFKVLKDTKLSRSLKTSSSLTPAEAYNKDAEMLNIDLQFKNSFEDYTEGFRLLQNTPNPFGDMTTIGFYLPENNYAQVIVTNTEGKVVKMIDGEFTKGFNQIKLNKAEIGSNGMYYYQLNTATESKTMKMIIIE